MTIRIKREFDLWTIIMSAYLINQFYFSSYVSIQRVLLLGCLFLYTVVNIGTLQRIWRESFAKGNVKKSIISFLVWIIAVALTPIIHGTKDYSYINYCFTFLSWALYLLAIVIRIRKKYPSKDLLHSFLRIFVIANCLYVFGSIMMLVTTPLREFVLNYVYMSEHQKALLMISKFYTRIGWSGFSAYTNALKCSIGFSIALYFMYREIEIRGKFRIRTAFYACILLVGNAFYARTGLICCAICAVFFVLYLLKDLNYWFKAIRVIIIAACVIGIGLVVLNRYSNTDVVGWMFEVLVNYTDSGTISTMSSSILKDMYFIPQTNTLLFGDGIYTASTGSYYMNTDVGLMRLILYFGVFFTALIYVTIISLMREIKKSNLNSMKLLSWLLMIVLAIFEIKGESIVIVFPLIFLMCLVMRKDSQMEEVLCNQKA